MFGFLDFLGDETGALTIEWVALAAGTTVLGLGIVSVLDSELEAVTLDIAVQVDSRVQSTIADD